MTRFQSLYWRSLVAAPRIRPAIGRSFAAPAVAASARDGRLPETWGRDRQSELEGRAARPRTVVPGRLSAIGCSSPPIPAWR